MKKIGIIAVCDFVNQPNGGEVFLINNFLKAHVNEKIEYFLIGMTFDNDIKEGVWKELIVNNKTYHFLPVAKITKKKEKTHIPFRLLVVLGLYKYWNKIKEMSINSFYIHSAELGIPLWKKQIPIVYHVHGDPSQTLKFSRFPIFRIKLFTKLYLSFVNRTIKESKTIIWAANRSKKLYLEVCGYMREMIESKSCTIHSSFDVNMIVNDTLFSSLSDSIHLVTVARLAKIKHIDFIIKSVYHLWKSGVNVDLLVCGDGEELQNLKNLSEELGISDKIIFLGLLNRIELATILQKSECFLFASENEAMSLVVLESLYMGTPVVSTNVGDIDYVLKDGVNGYLVNTYDVDEYSSRIKEILDKGKMYYKDSCIKSVSSFTPEKMLEEIEKVLL